MKIITLDYCNILIPNIIKYLGYKPSKQLVDNLLGFKSSSRLYNSIFNYYRKNNTIGAVRCILEHYFYKYNRILLINNNESVIIHQSDINKDLINNFLCGN